MVVRKIDTITQLSQSNRQIYLLGFLNYANLMGELSIH